MTPQVGDRGVDTATPIDPAKLTAAGGRFLFRYSAGAGNTSKLTQHKLCQEWEIPACHKAGIAFYPNSEWYEGRVTEGRPAGLADGKADLAFWQSRHLAKGRHIRVSWDQPADPKQFARVLAYLVAYEQGLGGYYHVAAPYAGTPFLRWLAGGRHPWGRSLPAGWRSESPSFNNDGLPFQPDTTTPQARAALVVKALLATPAAFVQTGNTWNVGGVTVDENVMIRVPADAPHPPAKPPTPPPPPPPPVKPPTVLASIANLASQIEALATQNGAAA